MGIDPKYTFWLGIFTTVFVAVGSGTIHLTNMFAESWIPTMVAWNQFLGFVGTAVMTALSGYSSKAAGPLITGDKK